jgi:hypothetical protein
MKYVIFSILLVFAQNVIGETVYKTYSNKRFEYSINYPKDILYPQGEADNGDGQKFLSKEADATLLVYGSHNINDQTIEERYREDSRGGTADNPTKVVSYRLLKENWFVVSGYLSGNIFYQKTILNNNQFKTFYFEYPETKKKFYDPIVKRLSSSFKG